MLHASVLSLGEQLALGFWLVRIFQHSLQFSARHGIRHVDRDPGIRIAEYLQGDMLELQVPQCRMLHDFIAIY